MDFRPPRKKPEKAGATKFIEKAKVHGWEVHRLNVSAGIYSTPGFPDYYLTHAQDRRSVWVETKSPDGRLRLEQVAKMKAFSLAGVPCFVIIDDKDFDKLYDKYLLGMGGNWWQYCMNGKVE